MDGTLKRNRRKSSIQITEELPRKFVTPGTAFDVVQVVPLDERFRTLPFRRSMTQVDTSGDHTIYTGKFPGLALKPIVTAVDVQLVPFVLVMTFVVPNRQIWPRVVEYPCP